MRILIAGAICLAAFIPGAAQERAGLPLSPAPQRTEVAATALPDAPTPSAAPDGQQNSSTSKTSSTTTDSLAPGEGQQTKRILWIVPNFRAVSAGAKLPPQSVKEKFKTGALDSFDYSSFIFRWHPGGYCPGIELLPGVSTGSCRVRPLLLAHVR